jgi:methanogenic corrinoid protein MtbC1
MEKLLDDLMDCLKPLDLVNFERKLNGAVAVIPFEDAMFAILLPLQKRVGQLWHEGQMDISIEHYVTKQVQQKIFTAMNQFRIKEEGPSIIVGCPPGENHEIGAQSVAYFCRIRGCRVYYLGGDVPISSLAGLCKKVHSDLVLLSITVANSENPWESIIKDLSEEILPLCPIWVGGAGAQQVKHLLEAHHIPVLADLEMLEKKLFSWYKKLAQRS